MSSTQRDNGLTWDVFAQRDYDRRARVRKIRHVHETHWAGDGRSGVRIVCRPPMGVQHRGAPSKLLRIIDEWRRSWFYWELTRPLSGTEG